ncbi:OmpA family protein [Fusobacterium nucleatum subsp. nucleatum ATCC 25586]|uniref:OmpA family protein n=2 Tax=Fusobacterium nucleatum subsp. nucleatum (strain ATCC 25586 / DSM 15643 / BCRC 10681 / CIP 101130 / JCM 8532 / KCTC 2640 / LMG 13131 / VPI 4355) TaxID=190304 RepID=A0ABM6TRS9_FUSNN|nr:OmpA family protein [Fusobacterium nucleatum]ALF24516.1 porin [Fusobacterium nucleatum subsp. nucleatum ChDC F316]ASG26222.1 porin [Fusobacterium nucleatum subsp. nucleatum]AVQ15474.1 OmpA family protein [Fusobacterium nucleatum subsp. nucleatum ATCC 25586]WMS30401.1 OmpA family protein [Fusobacterium nucleatum]
MKKEFLISIIVAILLVFGVKTYYDKKTTNNTQVSTEKEVSNENEMLVPGYALGEIPAITAPEMPDLSVTENPDAKITLDMTKKISSVPGISVTPVKVENSNIVGGDYSMQIGKNGDGQFTDKDKTVQTDGKGAGQYTDENITIQRNEDGSGQYTNKVTGVTLQVDTQGEGQYLDEKNKISFQIGADGTGVYKDENNDTTITIGENNSTYTKGNITIENNGDGSGTYNDKEKELLIENDGKGKAIITLKGKTIEVEAKPLEKPEKFPKLKMVPPVPSIEANSLLITLDSGILFDVDKYDVRPEAEEVLKNLVIVLKEADIKAFEIDGHTDSDASDEHNQVLSENRANAVKNFLTSQGIMAEITIKGYGESRPIASNDTPEGKQKNRRVEIVIPTI